MFQLPRVMGHRGAAALAPENTLAGIRAAVAAGMSWVEFDVMLSGDGVPVLFHDDNLKRITGVNALMAETPFAALSELEAGAWFAPAFAGEAIPSLEDALALALDLGIRLNVEIKPTPGRDEETTSRALEVLARAWPAERPAPLISSFSRRAVTVAQAEAPHLPRALIAWRVPRDWKKAAAQFQCSSVHIAGKRLSQKAAARIKAGGYQLAAFTVNDSTLARKLAGWGVDCIITDRPDLIAPAFG